MDKTRLLKIWIWDMLHHPTPQGFKRLRVNDKRCPLGDLCEKANIVPEITVCKKTKEFLYSYNRSPFLLRGELADYLDSSIGSFPGGSIASLNDVKCPKPFIAVVINYYFLLQNPEVAFFKEKIEPLISEIYEKQCTLDYEVEPLDPDLTYRIYKVVEDFKLYHYEGL